MVLKRANSRQLDPLLKVKYGMYCKYYTIV